MFFLPIFLFIEQCNAEWFHLWLVHIADSLVHVYVNEALYSAS